MLRGINRQDIFEDAEDYYTFIRMMAMVANQGNQGNQGDRSRDSFIMSDHGPVSLIPVCHIYAYCLMPNHVHLLIAEKDWRVGEVVKSIASCYVLYYNKKYGRIGHLLQDRLSSKKSYKVTPFHLSC